MTETTPACIVCGRRNIDTAVLAVDNATAEVMVTCVNAEQCQLTAAGTWLRENTWPVITKQAAAMMPGKPLLVTRARPSVFSDAAAAWD